MLYPLKFEPIYKERIWGGSKLRDTYDRICPEGMPVGESWELSSLDGSVSVVSDGPLAGNDIRELAEVYMGELLGERVYNVFGEELPVLVKFLDARELLSVQVHPGDEVAAERHDAYGKCEMWYVMEAAPDSVLYLGFKKDTSEGEYLEHLAEGKVAELLKEEKPEKGSMYLVPPGTIHAIGAGIFLAEIQQTSDITYRVFDWNRTDADGRGRELHTEEALGVLNFDKSSLRLDDKCAATPNFTVNLVEVDGALERDYHGLDSFVIYVCVEGGIIVECSGGAESLLDAETLLLPAVFDSARLTGKGKLLEVYMPR